MTPVVLVYLAHPLMLLPLVTVMVPLFEAMLHVLWTILTSPIVTFKSHDVAPNGIEDARVSVHASAAVGVTVTVQPASMLILQVVKVTLAPVVDAEAASSVTLPENVLSAQDRVARPPAVTNLESDAVNVTAQGLAAAPHVKAADAGAAAKAKAPSTMTRTSSPTLGNSFIGITCLSPGKDLAGLLVPSAHFKQRVALRISCETCQDLVAFRERCS